MSCDISATLNPKFLRMSFEEASKRRRFPGRFTVARKKSGKDRSKATEHAECRQKPGCSADRMDARREFHV